MRWNGTNRDVLLWTFRRDPPETVPMFARARGLLLQDLTARTLGAFYETFGEIGFGFSEAICAAAMAMVLTERGIRFERQPRIEVRFRGSLIGLMRPDFIIENTLLVELKTSRSIEPWHEAQVLKYLRATSIEIALLLNFGPRPTFKRFILTNDRKR